MIFILIPKDPSDEDLNFAKGYILKGLEVLATIIAASLMVVLLKRELAELKAIRGSKRKASKS